MAAGDSSGDPELIGVLGELMAREPIFHRRDLVSSDADFEREVAPDFWEIGASGRRYDRDTVLATLRERWAAGPVDESESAGWTTHDARVRSVGADHYLVSYTLRGQGRVTRRLTAWRRTGSGWQALYHQGTVVEPT